MKLWQKIFLWTLLIVMVAISSVEILLLKNNFDKTIEKQTENSISAHAYMISNINNKLLVERMKNNSILLTRANVIRSIREIFDGSGTNDSTTVALFNDINQVLYSNASLVPDMALLERISMEDLKEKDSVNVSTAYYTQILTVDGRLRLFVASAVRFEQQTFMFVTSDDISDILVSYNYQLRYAKLISIASSLVCAALLLILVKFLLRPLEYLNKTTHAIASGDYHQRVKVHTHDELGMLAQSMNSMADSVEENITQLQEVAQNRKDFINNLSHELKTPLTSILGFADIMRIKRNITSEEISDYSSIIFEEAKRLKNLSGKLMELITIGETTTEPVKLHSAELFSRISLLMQPIMQNNHLQLTLSCDDCLLIVDIELFQSMLINFIDNAIKASARDSEIQLNGTFSEGIFVIRITDHGIGIPEKELSKITEPFYMVDKARSRKSGGAGLGLALCKNIALLHHADFTITSEVGQGTTITLSMPAEAPTELSTVHT